MVPGLMTLLATGGLLSGCGGGISPSVDDVKAALRDQCQKITVTNLNSTTPGFSDLTASGVKQATQVSCDDSSTAFIAVYNNSNEAQNAVQQDIQGSSAGDVINGSVVVTPDSLQSDQGFMTSLVQKCGCGQIVQGNNSGQ